MADADEISDRCLVEQVRADERVIWVARERKQMPVADPAKDLGLVMPDATLNRLSQLNLALFLMALNRHVGPEEKGLGLVRRHGVAAPGHARHCQVGAGLPVAAASHERDGGDATSRQVARERLTPGTRRL